MCRLSKSTSTVGEISPSMSKVILARSAFFICCFCGNALPVIGIGIISTVEGPITASLAFALMITLFALVALGFGLRTARRMS